MNSMRILRNAVILPNDVRLGGVRGMAKKKAGGSSTNGRESAGRRLGIKVWPNTFASEWRYYYIAEWQKIDRFFVIAVLIVSLSRISFHPPKQPQEI